MWLAIRWYVGDLWLWPDARLHRQYRAYALALSGCTTEASTGAKQMTNPIQTKRIEMADKRKGKGIFYFSGSKAGRISWADWFYIREKGQ